MGSQQSMSSLNLLSLNALLLTFASQCIAETQNDEQSTQNKALQEKDHTIAVAIGGATLLSILIVAYNHNSRAKVFDQQFTLDDLKSKDSSGGKQDPAGEGTLSELYQTLDQAGSFQRELNGSLTKEAFMQLRKLVMKHVSAEFKPIKEKLMQERLDYFKKKDEPNYMRLIQEAQKKYFQLLTERFQSACEYLDISPENMEQTNREVMAVPENQKLIMEEEQRQKIDEARAPVTESKTEIKKIYLEKLRMDSELRQRMTKVQFADQQQAQQMQMVETTKIYDTIYLKYGTKFHYLIHALEHYELNKDDDIGAMEKQMVMEQKRAQEDKIKQLELPEEEMKLVDEQMVKIQEKGTVPVDHHGIMPLDRYLDFQRAAMLILAHVKNTTGMKQRDKRVAMLKKDGDTPAYKNLIKEHLQADQIKQSGIVIALLKKMNIPPQCWQVSTKVYASQPESQMQLKLLAQEAHETIFANDGEGRKLSKEETLNCIRMLERQKAEQSVKFYAAVKSGKIMPQQMGMMMEIEKMAAFDKLFQEMQIEEIDVNKGVKNHGLAESEELKAILAENQAYVNGETGQNIIPNQ